MNIITTFKQADKMDLFLLVLPFLLGIMFVTFFVLALTSGDSHAGQHCTQHMLIPTKVGNVTVYNNLCTEWSK